MLQTTLTRRQMLARSAAGVAAIGFPNPLELFAAENDQPRFKIGACDWSMGHRGQIGSLKLGKQIGLDGVEVCIPGTEHDIRSTKTQKQYLDTAKALDIEICSLGIGLLHNSPYSSDPSAQQSVEKCVATMQKLNKKVLLLPFFSKCDIKNKPQLQQEVTRRLKKIAPKVERAGVVLGLETTLNADEHMRIIDAVDSPAVKVYYDTANMNAQGYDIYKEIRQLGRDRICQFHCRENGALLGQGCIDFLKVRDAINDIGYQGWLVIEGSTVKGKSIVDCHTHNRKYLQKLFISSAT